MFGITLTLALFMAASSVAVADEDFSLEPCINGGVSSNGLFPTQEMEEQIQAYFDWQSDEPYYLFRAAKDRISTAHENN